MFPELTGSSLPQFAFLPRYPHTHLEVYGEGEGLSPPALQNTVALWMEVTLACPAGTKQSPSGDPLSLEVASLREMTSVRGTQTWWEGRPLGVSHGHPIKLGASDWGLGKSEPLWMPGSGKDAVVPSAIPETDDTGSKRIPCLELTCTPSHPQPHCEMELAALVQLRMHRSPGYS